VIAEFQQDQITCAAGPETLAKPGSPTKPAGLACSDRFAHPTSQTAPLLLPAHKQGLRTKIGQQPLSAFPCFASESLSGNMGSKNIGISEVSRRAQTATSSETKRISHFEGHLES